MLTSEYFLSGSLDAVALSNLYKALRRVKLKSEDEFHLYIQSEGGSVGVGMSMAQLLRGVGCTIITYNLANVDSAAIGVFAAGDKRISPASSVFYVHAIGKELCGVKTAEELKVIIAEIEADTRRVTEYLSSRTKLSQQGWYSHMRNPCVLTTEKAYEIGLVTSIEDIFVDVNRFWDWEHPLRMRD